MQREDLKNNTYFKVEGNNFDVYILFYKDKNWYINRVYNNNKQVAYATVLQRKQNYMLCSVQGFICQHVEKLYYKNMHPTPYTHVVRMIEKFKNY